MRSRPSQFTQVDVAQDPETLREGPQTDQSNCCQPTEFQGMMHRTMLARKNHALEGLEMSRLDVNSKHSDR